MKNRFFISHYDGDKKIADLISMAIGRISLGQIESWYSSDNSPKGGLKPGNKWFEQIISKLTESKAIIAILTPNSIKRPWIYFECGIAESISGCEIIPVCIGMEKSKIPTPLSLYQTYQLSDLHSLNNFLGKLLENLEVTFDEEMFKPIVEQVIGNIGSITFEEEQASPQMIELIQDFKSHFDKRFIDILERPRINIRDSTINDQLIIRQDIQEINEFSYSVTFQIRLEENVKREQFLEIRNSSSFAEVTNELFYLLSHQLEPFTYLEKWAIRNKETGDVLAIKEVQNLVPANSVIRPEQIYEVISLASPYYATK